MDERGEIIRSTSRAPHKDSITVPDGGYVVLRFRADNPGKTENEGFLSIVIFIIDQ